MSRHRPLILALTGFGIISASAVWLLNLLAVDAFTLPGDNFVYFLPLIQAHARELLDGHLLGMTWAVGAGWSPFESAAIGLFYPGNHLSLLMARILGNPNLMLEVSAGLHLWLAGTFTFLLLPRQFTPRTRFLLSVLFMLQPAPILLGRNWHIYLVGYPWFLALILTAWRTLEGDIPCGRRRLTWSIVGALLFLGTHPQIYIFGMIILAFWMLAESPNPRGLSLVLELGLSQLPMAVPLFYIKQLSMTASPNMMAGRGETQLALAFAQPISTVVQGILFGNLAGGGGFHLWRGVSELGIGIFLCPAWVACLGFTLKQKKWALAAFFTVSAMILGIASFPWLRHLFHGPLAGFRWTWKLTMLLCPLALVVAIRHWPKGLGSLRSRHYVGCAQGLLALLVIGLGQDFDLLPSASAAYSRGVAGILAETRACLASAGLPPGTRIAVIGGSGMSDPLPIPILGLMGAAPMLSGYETPCSYEPLEPAKVADLHLGLSVPWRIAVPAQAYFDHPSAVEARLRDIGVQGIVTRFSGLFPVEGTSTYDDSIHRRCFIRVIAAPEPLAYPYAAIPGSHVPVRRMAGGVLELTAVSTAIPKLEPARDLVWTRGGDDRWRGYPRRPARVWWIWGAILAAMSMLGLRYAPDVPRP